MTFLALAYRMAKGRIQRRLPILALTLLSTIGLVVSACGGSTGRGSSTPTAVATATQNIAVVKVYFARHPETDGNPATVLPVTRPSTEVSTQMRATAALREMLMGPNQSERLQGYYSPFDGQLALQSVCPGEFRDFDVTLDHKGATPEQGTATVRFCRRVDIPGDMAGFVMSHMITNTLKQFPSIKKVVILNYLGACFNDMQGANACLSFVPGGRSVSAPPPGHFA